MPASATPWSWRCWIFDLDGTLTRAVHDFEAIRAELDLPLGRPLLEALAELPAADAARRFARLDAIELDLARGAEPAHDAAELLQALEERGTRCGIVTRNSLENARETLRAAGLERFFSESAIIGRDEAAPKPDPDGIRALLDQWSAGTQDTVMVGDHRFDLQAGRAAGVATIYVDMSESYPYAEHADHRVANLRSVWMRLP
jgi:HAD superfamily hydrolase (TIGR01549 family)